MTYDREQTVRLRNAIAALERIQDGDEPTAEDLCAAPILEAWYLTEHHQRLALAGVVSGHPTLPDGAHIATSWLLWLAEDRCIARTISRFYRLGTALEDLFAVKDR